jgi:hypothetical protein
MHTLVSSHCSSYDNSKPIVECSLAGYKRGICVPRQQAIIGTLSSAIVQIVDWVTAPVVIVRT